jgi:hypothetical protein
MKYKPRFKTGDKVVIIKQTGGHGTPSDYYHDEDWDMGDSFIIDFVAVYSDTSCYFPSGDDYELSGVMEDALELDSVVNSKLGKAMK